MAFAIPRRERSDDAEAAVGVESPTAQAFGS
jgi:hypothetical protein